MAYLVLVAGAVMVLIGAMAIVTGYPIIQVERGWATVIAGTSLLAGGVVTMALALVLRALFDLRLALVAAEGGRVSFEPTGGPQHADRSMEPSFASREEPIPLGSPHRDQAMLAAAAVAVPATALALHETDTQADEHKADEHRADQHVDDLHHAEEHHPLEVEAHEAQAPDTQAHDGHAAVIAPDAQAHEAGAHEPAGARLDDWLDRAFADLHEPAEPVRAELPAPRPVTPDLIDHAPATQPHDEHLEAHDPAYEPHAREHNHEHTHEAYAVAHAEPATATPVASPPTSAVIGRYEADGTSYTMYADGSIDAQSDATLYRFGSMAELKAFIEG